MPTGINPERQKGIPLTKAALALTPLTIGVLSACSNNPALAKLPEGVTPIATDTATAIIPMTPAHAPSIIPASPAITVEVSPLPPSKATETITATVPVITPTVGTPLPIPGTPFAIPSSTETKPTATVTKTVIPTATKEATATPTRSPEEIRKEAHELSIKLITGPNALIPSDLPPDQVGKFQAAIQDALTYYPYNLTAKTLNDFILQQSGKDFAQHMAVTYSKYNYKNYTFDLERVLKEINVNKPEDLFRSVGIMANPNPSIPTTQWRADTDMIYYSQNDLNQYYPELFLALGKEAVANYASDYATSIRWQQIHDAHAQGKPTPSLNKMIGGEAQANFGEEISMAIEAYMLNQYHKTGRSLSNTSVSDYMSTLLNAAFTGGVHTR